MKLSYKRKAIGKYLSKSIRNPRSDLLNSCSVFVCKKHFNDVKKLLPRACACACDQNKPLECGKWRSEVHSKSCPCTNVDIDVMLIYDVDISLFLRTYLFLYICYN